jgi:predicted nucleotidyltransferase
MKGIKNNIRKRWYLRWVLLLSNWAAQGILRADRTEKIYKIFFSLVSSVIFFIIIERSFLVSLQNVILVSIFLGHTSNWLINGTLFTLSLHSLLIGNLEKKKAFEYLMDLKNRLENKNYISACSVFGSISRGELKGSSDIDICFIREHGLKNALRALFFMVKEKFKTNRRLIPIEPYLADSVSYMKKRYRSDEPPVIIKDEKGIIIDAYDKTFEIVDAVKINNVAI